jgi:hypothetical protein
MHPPPYAGEAAVCEVALNLGMRREAPAAFNTPMAATAELADLLEGKRPGHAAVARVVSADSTATPPSTSSASIASSRQRR